ncbi:MAG TPA: hypothetical protein H9675_01020, partial [Firmicutes bacterium]|nr:hypothetical protein [Bacillota bacterium]
DTTGTDIEKLKTQIATIEDKRTKLIDIYMSGDISKDEFSAARSKCDAEIAELQSVIDSIDKQQAMIRSSRSLCRKSEMLSTKLSAAWNTMMSFISTF